MGALYTSPVSAPRYSARRGPRLIGWRRSTGHHESKLIIDVSTFELLAADRKELDVLAAALGARETLDVQEELRVTGLPPAAPLDSGLLRAASAAKRPG